MPKISWLLLLTLAVMTLPGCQSKNQPPDPIVLTLYFADAQAEYLVAESREITLDTVPAKADEMVALVVNQLILGPAEENLNLILPPTTILNSAKVENQLATVDFAASLTADYWGGSSSELLTIYGVVNSITSLSGIEEVQLLVDGTKLETLAGHVEIREPLKANPELIKPVP